ncbi:hypothetical protein CIPAW_01G302400 [Carya illinoinensis]|uniref:Uncharacterized protein n=1 Tax=Carya illinoinensis TaxID=32201 RepID=A0A8T1RS95_CARIL|nr:hypothetical protein CIPAW_01G302400 [Carya illinoinensis]
MAAACGFPEIFCWVQNLRPISRKNSVSLCIFSSNFNLPVSLWTSKPFKLSSNSIKLVDEETMFDLLVNFIEDVLRYGSNKNSSFLDFLKPDSVSNFEDMFNFTFLTLLFLVCIYEAPADLRSECLNTLKNHLANCRSRQATKVLMKLLGSNLEEQWMRSINLAITSRITELQATHHSLKAPSPLFSYAISTFGLWKVHLYCPVKAMDVENSSNPSADERLQFSLTFHQLEGVVQFNYKVAIQETWVDVMVNIDNIRCDVIRLVNETLMNERGVGAAEKHFPSRISLQLTPIHQTKILSVSVSKSSENPAIELGYERGIEAGFEPQNTYLLGLKVSAVETMTKSLKPWKFEESVDGYSANLNWFLHDTMDGREVFSSKPSKIALLNPKAWFRDRYSSAYRPFNRQGGVIFAGDEYGERVCWKVDKSAVGRSMEWELRGWIWLTYWPNKYKTFYYETRRLEFREILHLTIA